MTLRDMTWNEDSKEPNVNEHGGFIKVDFLMSHKLRYRNIGKARVGYMKGLNRQGLGEN